MLVCTLGDLLLDVVVRLERPVTAGDDTPAWTSVSAGGQAANVAAWARALGAEARVIAVRTDDPAGRLAASEIEGRGVEIVGPIVAGHGGVVVSVSSAGEQRTMLTDRGASPGLRPEQVDVRRLRGCDALHLSGYALLEGPMADAGARAAGAARARGARVSVDLASAEGIRRFGPEKVAARLVELSPDVCFAGEAELEALGTEPPGKTLVVKRGAAGISVREAGAASEYDAIRASVVDTTGAGDALAAGFLVGGVGLGLEAAARCVSQAGAMP